MGQAQSQLLPGLVLAGLRHTLAASDAFVREGWGWFPRNAPEVCDVGCTALLVAAYGSVPAYVCGQLCSGTWWSGSPRRKSRITSEGFFFPFWDWQGRSWFEMTQAPNIKVTLGSSSCNALPICTHLFFLKQARTSSEDVLVSVRRMLAGTKHHPVDSGFPVRYLLFFNVPSFSLFPIIISSHHQFQIAYSNTVLYGPTWYTRFP